MHPREVCIQRGSASRGGLPLVGSVSRGVGQTPQDTWDTTGYGHQAGSTHQIAIHSCSVFFLLQN